MFFQAQKTVLPAMRHRSLNNFHKKWDNNKKLLPSRSNSVKKCLFQKITGFF